MKIEWTDEVLVPGLVEDDKGNPILNKDPKIFESIPRGPSQRVSRRTVYLSYPNGSRRDLCVALRQSDGSWQVMRMSDKVQDAIMADVWTEPSFSEVVKTMRRWVAVSGLWTKGPPNVETKTNFQIDWTAIKAAIDSANKTLLDLDKRYAEKMRDSIGWWEDSSVVKGMTMRPCKWPTHVLATPAN